MPSSFSWLDYSDHDRQKVLEVVQLFRERDSRDELGIGSIRDAFSDMLFPGTSTIQTRAKYFLFIPWIYQDIERRKIPSSRAADEARYLEMRLIDALSGSGDTDGVIGIQARRSLKQLPSMIYWQGLGRLGIRLIDASRSQYHNQLDRIYRAWAARSQAGDEERLGVAQIHTWHHGLPSPPPDFPEKARFKLTVDEARYLRERIQTQASGSLFSFFVDTPEHVPMPWDHSGVANLPAKLRERLRVARFFSEAIWGAALLYNLMLAELTEREALESRYRDEIVRWWEMIQEGNWLADLDSHQHLWEIVEEDGASIPTTTKSFVETWFACAREALVAGGDASSFVAGGWPRRLVTSREAALKRDRARLGSLRARELWGGASGAAQLDYRWPVTRTIIADICFGLEGHS